MAVIGDAYAPAFQLEGEASTNGKGFEPWMPADDLAGKAARIGVAHVAPVAGPDRAQLAVLAWRGVDLAVGYLAARPARQGLVDVIQHTTAYQRVGRVNDIAKEIDAGGQW